MIILKHLDLFLYLKQPIYGDMRLEIKNTFVIKGRK